MLFRSSARCPARLECLPPRRDCLSRRWIARSNAPSFPGRRSAAGRARNPRRDLRRTPLRAPRQSRTPSNATNLSGISITSLACRDRRRAILDSAVGRSVVGTGRPVAPRRRQQAAALAPETPLPGGPAGRRAAAARNGRTNRLRRPAATAAARNGRTNRSRSVRRQITEPPDHGNGIIAARAALPLW